MMPSRISPHVRLSQRGINVAAYTAYTFSHQVVGRRTFQNWRAGAFRMHSELILMPRPIRFRCAVIGHCCPSGMGCLHQTVRIAGGGGLRVCESAAAGGSSVSGRRGQSQGIGDFEIITFIPAAPGAAGLDGLDATAFRRACHHAGGGDREVRRSSWRKELREAAACGGRAAVSHHGVGTKANWNSR